MLKALLTFYLLFYVYSVCSAQCPFPLTLSTSANCLGTAELNVSTTNSTLSKIVWSDNNAAVQTTNATAASLSGTVVAGGNGRLGGNGLNQLFEVWDVFVDGQGYLYAADAGNNRIMKFPPNSTMASDGVVVAGGFTGNGLDQLDDPLNLFVDAAGNIYISDHSNSRVVKWAPGATSGIVVAGGNGAGSAANQLNNTYGVSVDASGNIYVVDGDNSRIQKWAPGATSGITVAGGNGKGPAANQLDEPTGMCMDQMGNIYVAEFSSNRISKWAPGATSGVTVAGGNGQGAAANQLNGPYDVALDAAGNLYIADMFNARLQKWAPGATSGITVAGGNGSGQADNQLSGAAGVFVDAMGNLFLADAGNGRVVEWGQRTTITPTYTPTASGTYVATATDASGCTVTSNAVVIYPVVTPAVVINADATTICSGSTAAFTAKPSNGGDIPSYQWTVDGVDAGSNTPVFSSNTLTSGNVVSCTLTSNAFCTTSPTAGSNIIAMTVYPAVTPPGVTINASGTAVCSTTPVVFTADVSDNGNDPAYQWQLNNENTGNNEPSYTLSNPADGDVVTCRVTTGESICAANVTSNSVAVKVYPTPSIRPGQTFSITGGQAELLQPDITGDIAGYLWLPSDGLSDNRVRNPLADPNTTMTYTLQVTTADNCSASTDIKVNVFRSLVLPNAFTPNGDGRNDLFYVLGGPPGSKIKDFEVFNKWGQMVFGVLNATPGDLSAGWDGSYKGIAAPAGVYVYYVVVSLADGTKQNLQGTVVLVR